MIYEVYRQGDGDSLKNRPTRYFTEHKGVAFKFMDEKNRIEKCNVWRVAIRIDNRICFDIDDLDINNLKTIADFYSNLFNTKFKIIKSLNGYHLISKRYKDLVQWEYDECRVMYPILEKQYLQHYKDKVRQYCKAENKRERAGTKEEYLKDFTDKFKASGLYCGVGNFDIYFCMSVLHRGFHCVRISKKSIDDKPIVLNSLK